MPEACLVRVPCLWAQVYIENDRCRIETGITGITDITGRVPDRGRGEGLGMAGDVRGVGGNGGEMEHGGEERGAGGTSQARPDAEEVAAAAVVMQQLVLQHLVDV